MLNCKLRNRYCNFCGLTFAYNLYSSHIYNCGSRTKPCEICKKNIILRDFEYHTDVCLSEDYETCEGEKYINFQLNDTSLLDLSKKNPFSSNINNCKTDIKIIGEIGNIRNNNKKEIKNETLLNIISQLENDCNFESDLVDEDPSHSTIQKKNSFRIKLLKAFNSKEEIGSDFIIKLNDTSLYGLQHNDISDAMFQINLTDILIFSIEIINISM